MTEGHGQDLRRDLARGPRRAGGLLALVLAAVVALGGCSPAAHSPSVQGLADPANAGTLGELTTIPPSAPASTTLPPAPTTTRPTPTTPNLTAPPTTLNPDPAQSGLRPGTSGALVAQLQHNLTNLGYWVGTFDGAYGLTTSQAVVALQKAAGLPRTGVVDTATAAALAAGVAPKPTSTSGHVIEVDLAHQLVLIVTNGHLDAALDTSTGGGYKYRSQGVTSVAITPVGHFTTTWQVDGTRVSPLGVLWRPKYFVGGIAIHGDSSVPAHPASHGCVRVSNAAINWIWATNADPIGTSVWVY